MSGVRFIVEGNDVYAHRSILAVRSEYFRVLLFNGQHARVSRVGTTLGTWGDACKPENAPIEIGDVSHAVYFLKEF
jgi:hypothetical protein